MVYKMKWDPLSTKWASIYTVAVLYSWHLNSLQKALPHLSICSQNIFTTCFGIHSLQNALPHLSHIAQTIPNIFTTCFKIHSIQNDVPHLSYIDLKIFTKWDLQLLFLTQWHVRILFKKSYEMRAFTPRFHLRNAWCPASLKKTPPTKRHVERKSGVYFVGSKNDWLWWPTTVAPEGDLKAHHF